MSKASRQKEYEDLVFEMTEHINNIRDHFNSALDNELLSEDVKAEIKKFLDQHSNDDMFYISDLINEDIERIIKERPDITRSDFQK